MSVFKGLHKIAGGGVNNTLSEDVSSHSVDFVDDGDYSSYSTMDELTTEITTGSQLSKLFSVIKKGLNFSYHSPNFSVIYPVGSIYMSINNVNPGGLFGGTWEQIKDTFLLAAGSSFEAGATGGEATHKLTANEMPSHTHTFTGTAESHTHTFTGTAASHTHTFTGTAASHNHTNRIFNTNNKNFNMGVSGVRLKSTSAYEWVDISSASDITTAGSTGGDNCGITRDTSITPKGTNTSTSVTPKGTNASTSVTPKGTNASTGGGSSHNNMPPYLAVYMWKRIS